MSLITNLQQKGLWSSWESQVMALEPVLQAMSSRGIPIDPAAYEAVVKLLHEDLAREKSIMQSLVPPQIKAKVSYKRKPRLISEAHFEADGQWFRFKPWTPSNQALVAYMRFKGHEVPKQLKDKNKDSTAAIELRRLYRKTGDPMYKAVMAYRKAQTVLTNHIKNWKPGEDHLLHPTFYFDPATGQLSSRRPNSQNAPHHDDEEFGLGYAFQFRNMVKAPPDHKVMEFDYHGFHVQTLAFNAQDPDMLRIGKIDIHSFVTAHFLKLSDASKLFGMKNDELADYLKWVKANYRHIRNAQIKHALLGYNNGMGYRKLFKQYMEFFRDESEAKKVLKLLDGLFPKAKLYRENICKQAHEQGYLISRHGYIRYFYEVFRVKWHRASSGEWKETWSSGDDHEAALCFYTQNDAHGELRGRLRVIHEAGWAARFNMINTIHDSIMFAPRACDVIDCRDIIKESMEKPSTVLINPICPNGLKVEVDVSVGDTWATMQEI
jgi:DNA polymerase I-like protein with 3'-5' exonuclease and polymerase domains